MIIFADVDGTHFNNDHRVEAIPADKSKTENWHEFNALHIYDQQIQYRIQYLQILAIDNMVVYLTGRTETFIDSSVAQLRMSGCPDGEMIMRGVNEHRGSAEFKLQAIGDALASRGLSDCEFILIDDDRSVCELVASHYPKARIVKVPSQCCAYLSTAMEG